MRSLIMLLGLLPGLLFGQDLTGLVIDRSPYREQLAKFGFANNTGKGIVVATTRIATDRLDQLRKAGYSIYDPHGRNAAGLATLNAQRPTARTSDPLVRDARSGTRAVVRVVAGRGRERSVGSGAHIGRGLVLSAAHVTTGADSVAISSGGRSYPARIVASDRASDIVLLRSPGLPLPSARLASRPIARGDAARFAGFGTNGQYRAVSGRVTGFSSHNGRTADRIWLVMSGAARSGDSGGPVFNSSGELVGNLWGSSSGQTWANRQPTTKAFLDHLVSVNLIQSPCQGQRLTIQQQPITIQPPSITVIDPPPQIQFERPIVQQPQPQPSQIVPQQLPALDREQVELIIAAWYLNNRAAIRSDLNTGLFVETGPLGAQILPNLGINQWNRRVPVQADPGTVQPFNIQGRGVR